MKKQFGYIFTAALVLMAGNVNAVSTLEIMSESGTSVASSINDQTTTYVFNKTNPSSNDVEKYYPEVKVTYSITQYKEGNRDYSSNTVTNNGLYFGDTSFIPLKDQGSPENKHLSSSRFDIAQGIDVNVNYGTRLTVKTSKLSGLAYNTSAVNGGLGHPMGTIKLTWNRPVTNPVINISGLGGGFGKPGYAAQFELQATSQVDKMESLSGVNFKVEDRKILNTAGTITATAAGGGSTGSIQVHTNQPVTTLTFGVYVRSDMTSGNFPTNSGDDAFVFSAASIDSIIGDPLVAKTNDATTVPVGGYTTYKVRATNAGGNTYPALYLNDRIAQGLQFVKVECSTAAANKCTDSSTIDPAKLFVASDADLTSAANSGQDTGPLAAGEFYEVLVTAKVIGKVGTTTINKASVKLPTLGGWITTNPSCKAYDPAGGVNAGLVRSFSTATGICSVTDTDTVVKPTVDLAVSKVADKANYNIGENAVYTIKAWNIGTNTMPDAVLTDAIPSNLAPLGVSCKAAGKDSAGLDLVCPTADKITLVGNLLTVNDMVLPQTTVTGTNPTAYLEFTVVALANTAGTSIANTAKIAVPLVGGVATATETITANNSSTATIAIKAPYLFSGRVFNDNSGTTKVAANAYNGIVNAGELGISGSTVTLKNCSGTPEYASVQTNGNGDFEIRTFQDVFDVASGKVCLAQKNAEGYQSVSTNKSASVTATAHTSFDLFTITKNPNANTYDGFLFGDAQLQLILIQNGQKNIAAGDVVEYPHEIISKSVHQLGSLNQSNQQQPATDPIWQSLIYYDANCNGAVDAGEKSYELALQSAPLSAPILPEQKICLVQRVMSPSNAKAGDSLSAQFSVMHTPTMNAGVTSSSNSVRDITTVGSAGLDLVKSVREVKSCPSTSADTAAFVKSNILTKVQNKESYLEYQISYTNNSAKKLVGVVLKDTVPLGTSLISKCTGDDCTAVNSSTQLSWNIAGLLAPRATGTVRFCTQVE